MMHVGCAVGNCNIYSIKIPTHKNSQEAKSCTWRSWGTDGAGNENLPRATTPWNSQSGRKMILHIKDNKYGK